MRGILCSLIMIIIACFATLTYAVPPTVTKNVVVLKNTTAGMCTSNWDGKGGAGVTEAISGGGENNSIASPGVRSCSSCVFDPQARTCTCGICYDYFDN